MAVAVHFGGPADGARVQVEVAKQTRHYALAIDREAKDWVTLGRYVFVPPRQGKECRYQYTGQDIVQGPVPGDPAAPDWS